MVATGISNALATDRVEIIDLLTGETTCQKFPSFPRKVYRAAGGLSSSEDPIICGGVAPVRKECYSFVNGVWKQIGSMTEPRSDFSITKSPFKNSSLIATGDNSAEILSANGVWTKLNLTLPVPVKGHCMIQINDSSVIVIGGGPSRSTYILNSETNKWTAGPQMTFPRYLHSCEKIPSGKQSSKYDIVVAGGYTGNVLTASVEFLDLASNVWRLGPELPLQLMFGAIVQHPLGGVVLIGGLSQSGRLDTIYYLPHSGPDATWQKLPQKLKFASAEHVAFLISDKTAGFCT